MNCGSDTPCEYGCHSHFEPTKDNILNMEVVLSNYVINSGFIHLYEDEHL